MAQRITHKDAERAARRLANALELPYGALRGGMLVREIQDKERANPMRNKALIEIRSRMDTGDKWGSVMAERFGIATALYIEGEEIPPQWEFRPGAISEDSIRADDLWPDVYWLETLRSGEHSAEDLVLAGNVLQRYSHLLERAGLDY